MMQTSAALPLWSCSTCISRQADARFEWQTSSFRLDRCNASSPTTPWSVEFGSISSAKKESMVQGGGIKNGGVKIRMGTTARISQSDTSLSAQVAKSTVNVVHSVSRTQVAARSEAVCD